MTSLLAALGIASSESLSPHLLSNAILLSFQNLGISPQDFPELGPQLSQSLNDLHGVYASQSNTTQDLAFDIDSFYASRKDAYANLLDEIKSSGKLLDFLSQSLVQLQGDLSSVSTSIAELQTRSQSLENRLEGRKLLESKLRPYISKTIIPPDLILTIMKTEPNETWLPAIEQLEIRLMSLKTRSKIEKQQVDSLEKLAEKLRLKASDKIRTFFLESLGPFRLSISPNLQVIQSSLLLKYQPFFSFLQRHSARIAHEVQKAYIGTVLWYYETSFRRYVRALEKIKSRGFSKFGLVSDSSSSSIVMDDSIVSRSKLEGSDVILAYMADDSAFHQPPEALFRSLSLIVIDNALSEWSFLNLFFGQASSEAEQTTKASSKLFTNPDSSLFSPSPSSSTMFRKQSVANSIPDSVSYMTECQSDVDSSNTLAEQKSQTVIDLVFKQIIGPVLEYHKTFTAKLLSTNDLPDTNSIYAMIQLNEALISSVGSKCAIIETHLMAIKMHLWPIFQIQMNKEIESMNSISKRKVNDEVDFKLICKKYVYFFSTMIGMESTKGEDDDGYLGGLGDQAKVTNELLKLREALVSLIQNHAQKMSDSLHSKKAFLGTIFQDIQSGLSTFPSNLVRSQAEAAYWRELARRTK